MYEDPVFFLLKLYASRIHEACKIDQLIYPMRTRYPFFLVQFLHRHHDLSLSFFHLLTFWSLEPRFLSVRPFYLVERTWHSSCWGQSNPRFLTHQHQYDSRRKALEEAVFHELVFHFFYYYDQELPSPIYELLRLLLFLGIIPFQIDMQ